MEVLNNLKKLPYDKFQKEIHRHYVDSKFNEITLAAKLNVKTTQTIRNAFHTKKQMVSDELLTRLLKVIGIIGKIEWQDGERSYFIKN